MNRREFTAGGIAALFVPQLAGCSKSETDLEMELLKDFLTNPGRTYTSKSTIESILYDISRMHISKTQGKQFPTHGRATHLGDNLFLTAYHVVDENVHDLRLIPQRARANALLFNRPFEVVAYDVMSDLALLKTKGIPGKGKATIHLYPAMPALEDPVSTFIRVTGRASENGFDFSYGGLDFYDVTKKVDKLGRLIMPAHSLLFEAQGRVLQYRPDLMPQKKIQDKK